MSDEITIDTSGFNAGMEGLVRRLKIDSKTVIIKEAGELMKTLVKVTPPADKDKTKAGIADKVRARFGAASTASLSGREETLYTNASKGRTKHFGVNVDPERSYGGIKYYAADPQFLHGVAEDADMRKASVEQLRHLLYHITKSGNQTYPFNHPRKQKVKISRKIFTTPEQQKALTERVQKHVGRLKAGWLVAWVDGRIPITGSNLPYQWVTRHARGARGRYIDGLGVENFPTFSIGNFAQGIKQKDMRSFVQTALSIRTKAMPENARLIFSGKKNLADYASGKPLVLKD